MMAPMRIADFALERYFARWEFAVDHLLCASDVQGYPMAELLALADDDTRRMWDGLTLGYTESTGHPLLRAEIASLYEDLEPDDVLVFAGAEEAIFCLANVLLSPGDHAVVTWFGDVDGLPRGRFTWHDDRPSLALADPLGGAPGDAAVSRGPMQEVEEERRHDRGDGDPEDRAGDTGDLGADEDRSEDHDRVDTDGALHDPRLQDVHDQ